MGNHVADGGEEQTPERRIRHASETAAVLKRLLGDPTYQNMAVFQELHARHLRELGDEVTAARADERAVHARRRAAAHDNSSRSAGGGPSPGSEAPRGSAEREGADRPIRVQYAQAASQRADAALQ